MKFFRWLGNLFGVVRGGVRSPIYLFLVSGRQMEDLTPMVQLAPVPNVALVRAIVSPRFGLQMRNGTLNQLSEHY